LGLVTSEVTVTSGPPIWAAMFPQKFSVATTGRVPDAAPAALAHRIVRNQFDAERIERRDELHQRIHVAANHAFTGLHALDGRQRKPSGFSELALVYPDESPRGPYLPGCDQFKHK